ncbi:P-type conjugative transfer protein TrbL [Escherichia coli]|uniref:P-type conjugative transfer protein TrbL n=1 Tax=Gammaproteobacteria TaxID=1236 RepID=UPI00076068B7|nr:MULTISPECIES: P-type conjugative transfer protein TrbL [Gammaproteobacteria]EBG7835859.1 P-type conjugative transfer protein TrbL [Salmonella enterica]EDQ3408316.1 P-type conjugative transfer protein TrbL [Salmonella enterica subsp. enterica serovar Javiana]EDV0317049.1 P-type conjugative transfer protein TrbL [Salmonella enterica subsp. enterica serovar Coleypark]EEJ2864023.1 P-type conjugative transfer protein TrbL [Salmonella enterica subsp. enterica serovar Poona]EHV9801193.1 P-type con
MERRLLLFLVLASVLVAGNAMAANDLSHADTSVQGLLDLVLQQSHQWSGKLYYYAIRLFWLLATIQFVWTLMPLVMKQADFGEIVGELLRFVMVIGFFLAVMTYSVEWSTAIVDSFRDAAASASGLGRALEPGDMLAVALDFGRTMVEGISVFSPAKGILIAVCAVLVLACFAFIAAFMFVTLVESYVIINASVLFFGFGGSQWTRDFAIAPMRFTVAIGAKLFVLTLIVGLIVQSAKQWLAAYTNDEASLMTMVGLALVCCYLTKTIPDLIGGMISGTSTGGGSAIGGMAVAGAAGAAAAAATIATVGAAAPAAAGAAGAGGIGGGGLAAAINSSFASGGAPAAAATGGGGATSGIGASTGGQTAVKSAASVGARVGGSGAPQTPGAAPQHPSSGVQQAAKQAGKAAQGNDNNDQQATPKGGVVSSGNALSQAANGGAKMLGVMASMAVPGMENAHSLSLGAGSPPPVPGDANSTAPANGAETIVEESNVIRPASDTSSTPGRLASLDVQGTASNNDQLEK